MRVYPTLTAASRALAVEIQGRAREAVRARGSFQLVLAGGSTPIPLYERLARRSSSGVPWDRTDVWFGDERCVGPHRPESNYRMARRALLARAGIPPSRIHRIRGELGSAALAARQYRAELVARFGALPAGRPWFDLVLLGIGPDGHTASLFPGSPALRERSRAAVAVRVPGRPPYVPRVTLTLPALAAAREVAFLVAGDDKAEAVRAALDGRSSAARRPPAGRVRARGPVRWFLDRAAAQELPASLRAGSPTR
ncbi:MAG TPA: 6-phosphogluconolactonase [Thermoplasmata archaeon]|nr:6-phosphogluconolactonase [Thermoplasmata archaeon]